MCWYFIPEQTALPSSSTKAKKGVKVIADLRCKGPGREGSQKCTAKIATVGALLALHRQCSAGKSLCLTVTVQCCRPAKWCELRVYVDEYFDICRLLP